MTKQAHVKTVAAGGRPIAGPMQGVGGSKGAQVWQYNDVQLYVIAAPRFAPQLGISTNAVSNLSQPPPYQNFRHPAA